MILTLILIQSKYLFTNDKNTSKNNNPDNNRPPASTYFDELALATPRILGLRKETNKHN